MQPVKDRPFDDVELEKIRLLLSTYRDGSGQFLKGVGYMPDFLAFERVTALICGGETTENKSIFDVLVPQPQSKPFGISCKMATAQPANRPSWFMEMSNSAKKFQDAFELHEIDWVADPERAGIVTVELVGSWHLAVDDDVDLESSRYLVLTHDKSWARFQIACLSLDLEIANPHDEVEWCVEGKGKPSSIAGYITVGGAKHRLWQLYPNSGGQLKYYPPIDWAEWSTPVFQLEEPPVRSLPEKVEEYFPDLWPT